MVTVERSVSGGAAAPGERAMQSATRRSLRPRTAPLPALAGRALPVLGRSAAGLALGFAAEYALRSLARTLLGALSASPPAVVPSARGSIARTVVTELIVVEPARRG